MNARQRLLRAEAAFGERAAQWRAASQPWREHAVAHRTELLLAGGLAAGFAAAALPPRAWASLARFALRSARAAWRALPLRAPRDRRRGDGAD